MLVDALIGHLVGDYLLQEDWMAANKKKNWFPCFIHCCFYSLAVCLFAQWSAPWIFLTIFITHFAIDRTQFVKWWMTNVSHQTNFTQPPFAPWSLIVVDNTFHLLVLYFISKLI